MDAVTKVDCKPQQPLRVRGTLCLYSDTQHRSKVRLLEKIRTPDSETMCSEDKNFPTELHAGLSFTPGVFVD